MIFRDAIRTLFSTEALSLISSIEDIKDYLQNHIIFSFGGTAFRCKAVPPNFEDNKLA
jgi:hypothetical protein